ncbi:MAG: DUF1684 domain-containing protein [Lysobacter sp.]|nr:DUF1684 domain-containing protein [Lysobacter sp.]
MRLHLVIPLLALLPVIAPGCKRDTSQSTPQSSATILEAEATFANEQHVLRMQRSEDLLKPDGWTSLIGLHWIDPGPHYVGSNADNGIRLAMGPAQFGMLDRNNNRIRLVPNRNAGLTLDGEPLSSATELKTDADEGGPSVIGFDDGKGIATVIKRGERYALRVKHADAPSRAQFAGLNYWAADPAWVVAGRFVQHPPGKTIPIANIIGTVDQVPNPGAVEFERDGKTYRIEALDEGGDELFLVFADRTNGHGSYGAGRFLDTPKADANGRVMLDFNRSYSPPCAFTAFATCPLPPPENRLDLAITAGEKAYASNLH